MRRFRRKRRGTWFPVLGTNAGEPDPDNRIAPRLFRLSVSPGNGTQAVHGFPILPDVPLEGDQIVGNLPGQLSQALWQEYFIDRILGRIDLAMWQIADNGETAFPKFALVTCGIFVARANDNTAAGGANTPVGSATLSELLGNYGPAQKDTIREPWMWRKSWVLSNGQSLDFGALNGASGWGGFSTINNIGRGSLAEGAYIDVKSKRRVGQDDRLWFIAQATGLDGATDIDNVPFMASAVGNVVLPTPNAQGLVQGILDVRVCAQPRRAKGDGKF